MASKRWPGFVFWPQDWLSSPSVAVMSAAEEGGYIRLLCFCWQADDCGIPADDETLAAMSRLGRDQWELSKGRILACFEKVNGRLYNARLLKERESQDHKSATNSEAGRRSGEARRRSATGRKAAEKSATPEALGAGLPVLEKLEREGRGYKYPAPFENFWRLYPRHSGCSPAEAYTAFRKAIIRGGDAAAILEGVEVFAQAKRGSEEQFIPHATTWLNNRRWLTESEIDESEDASSRELRQAVTGWANGEE